ncbi:MAG: hypothetical protein QW604_02130 [Fervidicoccaceae archaeon]
MESQLVLVKKSYINNYWRYEFYSLLAKLYINVSASNEEEARKKAMDILKTLKPSEK